VKWNDTTAEIWDIAAGRKIATVPGNWRNVRFSVDGTLAITWDYKGNVATIWRIGDNQSELQASIPGVGLPIANAEFSPDCSLVATNCFAQPNSKVAPHALCVWDAHTGALVGQKDCHTYSWTWVNESAWAGNQLLLFADGRLELWDAGLQTRLDFVEGFGEWPTTFRLKAGQEYVAMARTPPSDKATFFEILNGRIVLGRTVSFVDCFGIEPNADGTAFIVFLLTDGPHDPPPKGIANGSGVVALELGYEEAQFGSNGREIVTARDGIITIWSPNRPPYWWGVAWLPEFWLTVLFAGALVWSVWRDRRL